MKNIYLLLVLATLSVVGCASYQCDPCEQESWIRAGAERHAEMVAQIAVMETKGEITHEQAKSFRELHRQSWDVLWTSYEGIQLAIAQRERAKYCHWYLPWTW